jgi:NADH-quinone oxidoreductase subunit J
MFPALDAYLGTIYFAGLAVAALACALGVVVSRHPLNAAVLLVGAMLSLSGIYALLDAPFLAVVQVLVYAGAVMMLVVFVIMVLNRARDSSLPRFDLWSVATASAPLALCGLLAWSMGKGKLVANAKAVRGEPEVLSSRMFDLAPGGGGWWLLFVAVGVTLLVAVVGAVLLSKRRLDTPADDKPMEAHDAAH